MVFISHRGNLNGRKPKKENSPDYIEKALKLRYQVEIDVWYIDGKFVLGHDKPQYEVDWDFFCRIGLWNHAKNIEAFEKLNDKGFMCFWHTIEDFILTNRKDIWVFPGKPLLKNSIAVLPETVEYSLEELKNCAGICSDEIVKYKESLL